MVEARRNVGAGFQRALAMVYSTRDCCPLSSVLKNTTFRKLDLFPSSDEEVGGIDFVETARKS
jgi:hypothetical protein